MQTGTPLVDARCVDGIAGRHTREPIAAGDEIALDLVLGAVNGKGDARRWSFEVVHKDVGGLNWSGRPDATSLDEILTTSFWP